MKPSVPTELEKGRVLHGQLRSTSEMGFNGAFQVRGPYGADLFLICSDGQGWEHVSVQWLPPNKSQKQRCPNWTEMNWVKDLVWDKTEWVIQFHPAEQDYVNNHPYVLHLWKPIGIELPHPPPWMVGIK